MSKSRGKLFETGRELLLQELLGYELGLTSQEDLWPRLKVALPKSDRVKRHIKRLLMLIWKTAKRLIYGLTTV